MSLYAGLRPPGATSLALPFPFFARYTPPRAAKTRSLRRPVEKDGSAPPPLVPMRLAFFPPQTKSWPPATKATFLQSPETATAVASVPALGGDTRLIAPPWSLATKASTLPLPSLDTRFEAADRNATHDGAWWNPPSIAGEDEGPLAGWPPMPRETRIVRSRMPRGAVVADRAAAQHGEHVLDAVGVARDEVGGVRLERDRAGEALVVGDDRIARGTVGDAAVERSRDELRGLVVGARGADRLGGGTAPGGDRGGQDRYGGDCADSARLHRTCFGRLKRRRRAAGGCPAIAWRVGRPGPCKTSRRPSGP